MTNRQLLIEFERGLVTANNAFSLAYKPDTDTILQYLNSAQNMYANLNASLFEVNEQIARNLIKLLKTSTIELSKTDKTNYIEYSATYPKDLMYMLDESVFIHPSDNTEAKQPAEIFECTLDSYMYRITNKLTDFHWRNNYARPLRVRTADGCKLYTDNNYEISEYTINYLRQLNPITLDSPNEEYSEFPENVHKDIVDMAVKLYLSAVSTFNNNKEK